ncbi:MAG: hypothetical protein ACREO3_04345, partial [Arenimonas sp.]
MRQPACRSPLAGDSIRAGNRQQAGSDKVRSGAGLQAAPTKHGPSGPFLFTRGVAESVVETLGQVVVDDL